MTDIRRLPVLSLTDVVVLPGMVVPIELDEAAQAALDAAQAAAQDGTGDEAGDRTGTKGELLLAPRLSDRYATYGVVASIEQVGRLAGGAPAAVLRAVRR
ncbi:MAG: LON peptidase substrate-binding domain-containing protein, partial [Nakamurella multipartita]